jgi:hypothetical protein
MRQPSEVLPHIYWQHRLAGGRVAVRGTPLPLRSEETGACLKCPWAIGVAGNFGRLLFLFFWMDMMTGYRLTVGFLPKARPRRL